MKNHKIFEFLVDLHDLAPTNVEIFMSFYMAYTCVSGLSWVPDFTDPKNCQ